MKTIWTIHMGIHATILIYKYISMELPSQIPFLSIISIQNSSQIVNVRHFVMHIEK